MYSILNKIIFFQIYNFIVFKINKNKKEKKIEKFKIYL